MKVVEEDLGVGVVVEVDDLRNSGMIPLKRALKSVMVLSRFDFAQLCRDDTEEENIVIMALYFR